MVITVLGSIAVDLVVKSKIRPEKGETVIGESFVKTFGGKGANQSVSASRFGKEVCMLGIVGDDADGLDAIKNLEKMEYYKIY